MMNQIFKFLSIIRLALTRLVLTRLAPKSTSLEPPTLPWSVVLALSVLTFGLFSLVWAYRQASFIKKIDSSTPSQLAPLQLGVSFSLLLVSNLMTAIYELVIARGGHDLTSRGIGTAVMFFELFMFLSAILQIRRTLTAGYGIQMNSLLTVLFHVFYIQHHLSRIQAQGLRFSTPFAGGIGAFTSGEMPAA